MRVAGETPPAGNPGWTVLVGVGTRRVLFLHQWGHLCDSDAIYKGLSPFSSLLQPMPPPWAVASSSMCSGWDLTSESHLTQTNGMSG